VFVVLGLCAASQLVDRCSEPRSLYYIALLVALRETHLENTLSAHLQSAVLHLGAVPQAR